jgi:hypothetical protein
VSTIDVILLERTRNYLYPYTEDERAVTDVGFTYGSEHYKKYFYILGLLIPLVFRGKNGIYKRCKVSQVMEQYIVECCYKALEAVALRFPSFLRTVSYDCCALHVVCMGSRKLLFQ